MLTDEDLAEMEQRARRFQGAWTGTSGSLAADVIFLLKERREILATLPVAATHSSSPTASESRPAASPRHQEIAGRTSQGCGPASMKRGSRYARVTRGDE